MMDNETTDVDNNNDSSSPSGVAVGTEHVTYFPFWGPIIRRTFLYIKTFFWDNRPPPSLEQYQQQQQQQQKKRRKTGIYSTTY